jgi:hypothetical protein
VICCTQFPYLSYARPDHGRQAFGRLSLNCELTLRSSASGWESTSSERLQQSFHIWFWKENMKLGRTLRVFWTGCWNVWTDAGWSNSKLFDTKEGPDGNPRHPDEWFFSLMSVQTVWHVVRKAEALDSWASGRYETSSGRLTGNQIFWLVIYVESSWSTLNSGIPIKKHLYNEVILSNRMWPITK